MIVFITVPIMLLLLALSAVVNYKLGLEDGSKLMSDREFEILNICCLYRQGHYTAHEVAEMVTEVMEEGYK